MKVSAVILTRNGERDLEELLQRLEDQTVRPDEILVIDSSSTDRTASIVGQHPAIRFLRIPEESFNHGGTRRLAISETDGELVLFMTQDAIPANNEMIACLIASLSADDRIVAAYARQIPRGDASPREKLVRQFNYPDQSHIQSLDDLETQGIKTFFLSDVCAMYRRNLYDQLGGFEQDVLSNEDMLFAAKAIQQGYPVAYAAEAQVVHSHNLSLREQYRRNRVQGYEIAKHQDLLGRKTASPAGMKMLKEVSVCLIRQGRLFSVMGLLMDCLARFMGNRAGQRTFHRQRRIRIQTGVEA